MDARKRSGAQRRHLTAEKIVTMFDNEHEKLILREVYGRDSKGLRRMYKIFIFRNHEKWMKMSQADVVRSLCEI